MQQVILFDGELRDHLLPLTYLRPVADLRIGIDTIAEKWAHAFSVAPSYLTQDYLADLFPMRIGDDNLLINGGYLPTSTLLALLRGLEMGDALLYGAELIAARLPGGRMRALVNDQDFGDLRGYELDNLDDLLRIGRPYDLFQYNDEVVRRDYERLTKGKKSASLSTTNQLIGPASQLFIAEGASIEATTLNTTTGPIYIGADALIMEGSLLRGPLAIGEHTVVKMGTRIYGATSTGPYCKLGGEINNVIFQAYSNKGHDGYLGNSVIGAWCNLGADTNASNLKNTYGEVSVWNYATQEQQPSGLQFCGLVLGDYSRTAINTMFNTGTVVGISANVFGAGFPPTFIPDFSWGTDQVYDLEKAFVAIERILARRGQEFSVAHRLALLRVYEETRTFRPI